MWCFVCCSVTLKFVIVLSQEIDNADGSNDDDDKAFIYSSSWLAKIC